MEQLIVLLFLAFFTAEFGVEFLLNELNLRHVRACRAERRIPDFFRAEMNSEAYDKSVEYTLARGVFERWAGVYGRVCLFAVLFGGVLPLLDRLAARGSDIAGIGVYGQGVLFCFAVGFLFSLLHLPAGLYSTFVLEERFGFNKTPLGLYIADMIKGAVLALAIGAPFVLGVLWFMRATGSYWWIWAFGFILAFQLLMIVIFPSVIAPWFNKFEPLKEGEFRDRILALADQVGFQTSGIYSMDGSKRSAHSNAYFTGIGKSKRIVLFDTLIEQMTVDQGLAVLAHEMGHYKMKHIRRMLLVQALFLFGGLYLLSLLLDFPPLFAAFGMTPSAHGALVLFTLLSGPVTFYLGPAMNWLSRKHEYEADRFAAVTLRDGKPMEEALVRLTVKNSSNLTPHPWYSAYHYSHPTAAERIEALRHSAA